MSIQHANWSWLVHCSISLNYLLAVGCSRVAAAIVDVAVASGGSSSLGSSDAACTEQSSLMSRMRSQGLEQLDRWVAKGWQTADET